MLLCCRLQYDGALLQRAEAASLPARREKAERIRSVQGRAASLAAGLLLRHGLFLCGLGEDQIRASPEGKPFLAGNPAFISLSHSGDYAACAIAPVPVGVDIQRIVPVSARAVRRFCTAGELAWVKRQPDPQRAAIALWALKESYLKASGALTEAVFAAEFQIEAGGGAAGPAGWRFFLDRRIEGYLLAVCEKD